MNNVKDLGIKREIHQNDVQEKRREAAVTTQHVELDFAQHDETKMAKAHNWSNKGVFDCIWRQENIAFTKGILSLAINKYNGDNYQWSGAEYRSTDFYGYGLYETKMKPIKNIGVVSSFFLYTGPSDNNPWDEIDIEFLGKDTKKVQFNYFTNGIGKHEYIHDLGFDAAENFHVYGFEWLAGSLTWYVDGRVVHKATVQIPSTAGKIMMNVWPGKNVDAWLGVFDGAVPLYAEYDWIRFTPRSPAPQVEEEVHYYTGWNEPWHKNFVFTEEGGATKVTYSKVVGKEWNPVYLPIITQATDYHYVIVSVQGIAGDTLQITAGSCNKRVVLTGNTDYVVLDISGLLPGEQVDQVKLFPSAGVVKDGWVIIRDTYFAQRPPEFL